MRRTKQIFIFAIVILLVLSAVLPAFAEGVHLNDLDMSKYNELLMLSGRSSAAEDEVYGTGYTTKNSVPIHSTNMNLGSLNTVAVIPEAGSCVTVYEGSYSGYIWSSEWLKVSYQTGEGNVTGYIESRYLNVFPAIEEGKSVTAEAGGYAVRIEGSLPRDAAVSVSVKGTDAIHAGDNVSVVALDIKLTSQGKAYRPDGNVRVTVSGLELYENGIVEVLHILDDAEAIAEHVADGRAIAFDDDAVVAVHSAEAEIARQVTGGSGVVYVEYLSAANGSASIVSCDSVSFSADSFSTYYIVSGNSENGPTENDITLIDEYTDTNYYYVAPGTHLALEREHLVSAYWGADRNDINGIIFRGKWTQRRFLLPDIVHIDNVSTTAYTTTRWDGAIVGHDFTRGDYLLVDIAADAVPGEVYTITSYRAISQSEYDWLGLLSAKYLHFIVVSQEDIIDNIMENTQYPVYLSILKNASSIPGEPGISDDSSYLYVDSTISELGGNGNHYHAYGSGVIDPEIDSNPYFTPASDGTNTRGIADASGVNTKAVLSGIDWDAFLDRIAANGTVQASDGTTVTNANKAGYEVVPYVVKLQTAYGLGWHIDCYVKPKDAVHVSYDANIPEGYIVANIAVPPSTSRTPPVSVTAGKLTKDGTAIELNGSVTATDAAGTTYTLTFRGWNTKSDRTGTNYNPGATGSFNEDTVLYAQWDSNIAEGTLEIRKTVVTAEDSLPAPEDDTFTFTVTFPTTSGVCPYTVYGTDGQAVSSGELSSGDTITLRNGEWVRITGVPTGDYSVTEADKTDYTVSSAGASGTILGGATSVAEFTNIYFKEIPKSTLTIAKSTNVTADTSDFTFAVTVENVPYTGEYTVGNVTKTAGTGGVITIKAGQTAVIAGIPVGAAYSVAESNVPVWYDSSATNASGTVAADGTSVASFVNTVKTISVTATKIWSDYNNAYGMRPGSISLQLMNGTENVGAPVTVTPDRDGNWMCRWDNIPKYAYDGSGFVQIEYSVAEAALAGYYPTYAGDTQSGFIVTNTKNIVVDTGIGLDTVPYVLILLAVAAVTVTGAVRRRRKHEE